jgi:hypothetical protein
MLVPTTIGEMRIAPCDLFWVVSPVIAVENSGRTTPSPSSNPVYTAL